MITYKPLSDKEREILINSQNSFLAPNCFEFAIAAQEATGWGIRKLLQKGNDIYHVFLESDGGAFFDARGFVAPSQIGTPFGVTPPYRMGPVDKETLLKILDISREKLPKDAPKEVTIEGTIQRAREFICAAWMEICSDEFLEAHSWAKKYLIFMEDIEKLCRRHDVGIREMFETVPPVLYPRYEDEAEAGFCVYPIPTDPKQAMFRRVLR